jgi:hypothetical protein
MRSQRPVTVQKRAREETTAVGYDLSSGPALPCCSLGTFIDEPGVVYNSMRDGEGRLDGTTPLQLRIRVCSAAAQALLNSHGATAVELSVAGVDGQPVVHFSAAAGKRVPIKPPVFTAAWNGCDELTLSVDRKTVPLTSAAGECPLVFAVMVGEDVAVSSSFLCFAKQKPGAVSDGEDRPQKRRAKGDDAQVTRRQATLLDRVRTMLGDAPVSAPPPVSAPVPPPVESVAPAPLLVSHTSSTPLRANSISWLSVSPSALGITDGGGSPALLLATPGSPLRSLVGAMEDMPALLAERGACPLPAAPLLRSLSVDASDLPALLGDDSLFGEGACGAVGCKCPPRAWLLTRLLWCVARRQVCRDSRGTATCP